MKYDISYQITHDKTVITTREEALKLVERNPNILKGDPPFIEVRENGRLILKTNQVDLVKSEFSDFVDRLKKIVD